MLIQLRQTEIETAIRQYVANQGINLTGKVVGIGFTSGRRENGITADVDIIEMQPACGAATLTYSEGSVGCAVAPQVVQPVAEEEPVLVQSVEPQEEVEEDAVLVSTEDKPVSLFG